MGLLVCLLPLTWAFWASLSRADREYEQVSDDQCQCYLTNGTNTGYYTSHKFLDFRALPQYAGVPDIIQGARSSAEAVATSDYFTSDQWVQVWDIQRWNNSNNLNTGESDATVLVVNSPNNIYIEKNEDEAAASETYLTMRTTRLKGFQSSAEIETVSHNYHYLSIRMLGRTVGSPGAITAMFTYRGSQELSAVEESDLEIRTMDPPWVVQYTNQPSYSPDIGNIPQSTRNVTLPRWLTYRDWAVYRMDWTPTRTTHYINGDQVAEIAFQNPRSPLQVFFNCWGDGGSWSGVMQEGGEAFFQIQWIEMLYNEAAFSDSSSSSARRQLQNRQDDTGSECGNVCSIDDSQTVGAAVLIYSGSTSSSNLRQTGISAVISVGVVLWTGIF